MAIALALSVCLISACLLSACGGKDRTESEKQPKIGTTGIKKVEETQPVAAIDVETGYRYEYYWDDAAESITASLKYPVMHLNGETRETYPKLEQAVADLMEEREEILLSVYDSALEAAHEGVQDGAYPSLYEVTETVAVRRADTRVLSLVLDGFYYTGGAHGMPYSQGVMFDTQTGKQLQLTDVVKDVSQLPALVEEQLEIFYGLDSLYEDLDLQAYFENNINIIQWVLDYHGITLMFQPYEISPFASGIQVVTIAFADHEDLFQEKYQEVPADYAVEFQAERGFYYDVDGNGTLDSIFAYHAGGESEDFAPMTIELNTVWFEEDTGTYLIEPALIHTAEGKNYLYVSQQYPDDFWVYGVYDLSGGNVEKVDMVYLERHNIMDYENDYYAVQALTDPTDFVLDGYTTMLGTAFGYDHYHIGADGLPVPEHDWYYITDETEFTMLRDLTVSVVDEDGNVTGKTKAKRGDTVTYYRTDGDVWADIILPDGTIGRVTPEHGDGLWTIDGVDIEEIFEGIMFGG